MSNRANPVPLTATDVVLLDLVRETLLAQWWGASTILRVGGRYGTIDVSADDYVADLIERLAANLPAHERKRLP